MDPLLTERRGDVVHITLNRPEVRNAFDEDLIARITSEFNAVTTERAVILAGEGMTFCAGGDLNWMRLSVHLSEHENRQDALRLAQMFRAVDECPCPVIAVVQGAAFGGGLGLVCCSDIVVAANDAKFCFSETKLGLAPAVIAPFAVRKIGVSNARRYFLTAEVLNADEAMRLGIVHEIANSSDIYERAQSIVAALLANGPLAVKEAKRLIREVATRPIDEALDAAADAIAKLRVSEEGQEGVIAFLDKRPPYWH